jgi:hypothetical protein
VATYLSIYPIVLIFPLSLLLRKVRIFQENSEYVLVLVFFVVLFPSVFWGVIVYEFLDVPQLGLSLGHLWFRLVGF